MWESFDDARHGANSQNYSGDSKPEGYCARELKVAGYDEMTVERHLEMLVDAGFVEGIVSRPLGITYPLVMVTDLSWAGHDFASAITNENIWQKIKQSFSTKDLTTMPLTVIKNVAVGLLTKWAESKVGL